MFVHWLCSPTAGHSRTGHACRRSKTNRPLGTGFTCAAGEPGSGLIIPTPVRDYLPRPRLGSCLFASFGDLAKPLLNGEQPSGTFSLTLIAARQRILRDVYTFPTGKRRFDILARNVA